MDSIPVTKEGVNSYPVKWNAWDGTGAGGGAGVRSKVSRWVSKKIVDMLGCEEPDLTDFVLGLLDKHSNAETVEQEVCGGLGGPLVA